MALRKYSRDLLTSRSKRIPPGIFRCIYWKIFQEFLRKFLHGSLLIHLSKILGSLEFFFWRISSWMPLEIPLGISSEISSTTEIQNLLRISPLFFSEILPVFLLDNLPRFLQKFLQAFLLKFRIFIEIFPGLPSQFLPRMPMKISSRIILKITLKFLPKYLRGIWKKNAYITFFYMLICLGFLQMFHGLQIARHMKNPDIFTSGYIKKNQGFN